METVLLEMFDWHTLDRLQAVIAPEGLLQH